MEFDKIKLDNVKTNNLECDNRSKRVNSLPFNVHIELTGKCSLKCVHCGFQVHGRSSAAEIDSDVYKYIVKTLFPSCRICYLGGSNYGEVTIAESFHQTIKDCDRYNVKIHLTTNGTNISSSWLGDLVNVLDTIGFSMEGFGNEYEKIRGFKWNKFLQNVTDVINKREQTQANFKVEWRFCVHSDNVKQLPEIIQIAKSAGVDRIQVMPFFPYLKSQKFKQIFYHRSVANETFKVAREIAKSLNFSINVPPDLYTGTFDQTEQQNDTTIKAFTLKKCDYPWSTITIDEKGMVKPCHIIWKPFGKISNHINSIDKIWNNRKYQLLRYSVNSSPTDICTHCRLSAYDNEKSYANQSLNMGRKELLRYLFVHRRPLVIVEDKKRP